jgi:hypothetical protein
MLVIYIAYVKGIEGWGKQMYWGNMVATDVESALLANLEGDRITLKCFLQMCWW